MRSPYLVVLHSGLCWFLLRLAFHIGGDLKLLSSWEYPAADLGGGELMFYFFDGNYNSSATTVVLQPDLSIQLPRGGKFYRLGDTRKHRVSARSRRSLRIRWSDPSSVHFTWDMLWSDFHGAFDQNCSARDGTTTGTNTMSIPWREPHEPLFLIVYTGEGDDARTAHFEIEYVEGEQQLVNADATILKAFSYPRRDLFYRKRTSADGKVTLCTQMTPERLGYLFHIVKAWGGPVSAVVYVGHKEPQDQDLTRINGFLDDLGDDLRANLDLHLVYDDDKPWYSTTELPDHRMGNNPYPINLLRQIAVDCVKTEWLFMTEGDMLTPPNTHQLILDSWEGMMAAYRRHSGVGFIAPLYISRTPMDDEQVRIFPKKRQELITKRKSGIYQRSGEAYGNQGLTDFESWEALPKGSDNFLPYHESGIESAICDPPGRNSEQEPYYLVRKEDMAPYNVLFAGMWWDKTTQIIDACNCGLTFLLHPDLFSVIYDGPNNATGGTWAMHKPNWRQKMIFTTGPAYSQEYQKARLAIDGGHSMCSKVTARKRQPYRPWVPFWLVNEMGTHNKTLRVSRAFGASEVGKVSLKSKGKSPQVMVVKIRKDLD